jgi:tRNA A58 N-methylase Trm61
MATDIKTIVANLLAFYDFRDKTIISVGAGGGQLIEYGRTAGKVIAVDNDPSAMEKLRENLKLSGLEDKFTTVLEDFDRTASRGDAVLFEFCLHEMSDPEAAVRHARSLAPDVIIFDHWPDSEWSYIVAEEAKVAAGWRALMRFAFKKEQKHDAVQVFKDYEELYTKVKGRGETSIARIAKHKGKTDIVIPMPYGLVLI